MNSKETDSKIICINGKKYELHPSHLHQIKSMFEQSYEEVNIESNEGEVIFIGTTRKGNKERTPLSLLENLQTNNMDNFSTPQDFVNMLGLEPIN